LRRTVRVVHTGPHKPATAESAGLHRAVDANALSLMRRIKAESDPDGTLNP
jgi:FAD/FMN-containing dehydrogenase